MSNSTSPRPKPEAPRHRPRHPGSFSLSDPTKPPPPAHALVEADGIEPTTPCLQSRCSPTELRPQPRRCITHGQARAVLVGPGRFELPTSRLSSARSNQLSYEPGSLYGARHRAPQFGSGRDAPAAAPLRDVQGPKSLHSPDTDRDPMPVGPEGVAPSRPLVFGRLPGP